MSTSRLILKTPWYYGWNIVGVSLVFQGFLFGSIFFSYTLWVGEWLDDKSLAVTLTYVMVPITILNLAQSLMVPMVTLLYQPGEWLQMSRVQ